MDTSLAYIVAALMLCSAGVKMLHAGWGNSHKTGRIYVASGWLSILTAVIVWSLAQGVEYGITFTLLWLAIVAWLMIGKGVERRPQKDPADKLNPAALSKTSLLHKCGTFLVAGPVALIATVLLTAAFAGHSPGLLENRMAVAAIAFPILWAAVMVWVSASGRLLVPTLTLVFMGAASAGVLYL